MGAAVDIEGLVLKCRASRQAFAIAYKHGFFLLEAGRESSGTEFVTKHIPVLLPKLASQLTGAQLTEAHKLAGILVLPVEKRADSPWRNRISVGRARNNDLVIIDASISKLHAHMEIADDGSLRVTDQKSTNGIKLNGNALAEGSSSSIADGDIVTFGDVPTRYVALDSFLKMIDHLL